MRPERSIEVSEEFKRTKVAFDSGGVELVGYLHRPPMRAGRFRA